MKEKINFITELISEVEAFTFNNLYFYGTVDRSGNEETGLHESANWLALKNRSVSVILDTVHTHSSAAQLVQRLPSMVVKNYDRDAFAEMKQCLTKALEFVRDALINDVHGELKSGEPAKIHGLSFHPKKIFIVHGHDHLLKNDVERFLLARGLEPVTLHREPDLGKTVIEKFEEYSDVGFAIILLTPDEKAYLVDEKGERRTGQVDEFRTRPNVIFEFGYFIGKLGRGRVTSLLKGDVALPSDLLGILPKSVSNSIETVEFKLIRELQQAGYSLNLD